MDQYGARKRVLIVEDDMLIGVMLEDMLVGLGYTVVGPALSLEAGLEALAATEIDIAVLDVNLAGTPSFPIAEQLRERGIPFVFTTGYDSGTLGGAFADVPAVQKPYQYADIERALAACVR